MAEFSVAISPVISYYIIMLKPIVAERAQRTANENTQANKKKHLQIKNIFICLTAHVLQILTAQPNTETLCK